MKVLELSDSIAAAVCGRMLMEIGADVRRAGLAESPGSDVYPAISEISGFNPGYAQYLRFGKEVLDEEALDLSEFDIVIADGPAHTRFRDALDEERQVVVVITPYGLTGSKSGFRASEITLQAMGGWMFGVGEPTREPLKAPDFHALHMGGIYAYIAALAAHRQLSGGADGRGQLIDVSLMECVLWSQMCITTTYEYSGDVWRRHGNRSSMSHPQGVYECKDGLIGVNVLYYAEWDRFPEFIGMPELATDERFTTPLSRAQNADALDEIIRPWLMQFTKVEIYRAAQENRLPFALVSTPRDLLENEQLAYRQYWSEQPREGEEASFQVPGAPYFMNGRRPGVDSDD